MFIASPKKQVRPDHRLVPEYEGILPSSCQSRGYIRFDVDSFSGVFELRPEASGNDKGISRQMLKNLKTTSFSYFCLIVCRRMGNGFGSEFLKCNLCRDMP